MLAFLAQEGRLQCIQLAIQSAKIMIPNYLYLFVRISQTSIYSLNYHYRRMQKQFVVHLLSKDGKHLNMEVKQKHQQVTKRKVKTWSTEEDNQLLQLYERYPKRWAEIATLMTDRNQNQCLHRYRRLSQLGKSHKIWSSEEDETIRKLIKKYGKNWKLLSEMLGSKNGKQIRERFINKLDPRIKKEDWSEEQDQKILQLYSKVGSKWSEISKNLPGRPENKIKNRFYSFIKKNFDITFREAQNIAPSCKELKNDTKCVFSAEDKSNVRESIGQRSFQLCQLRQQMKKSEERIISRVQIPSINEIEMQMKNQNMVSQNLLQSVMRFEQQWKTANNNYQDWKSNCNYNSILELNSDAYFRNHY